MGSSYRKRNFWDRERAKNGLESVWTGSERHIAEGISVGMNGVCHHCRLAPAFVYLDHHLLCGVCWNKVMWLRWAEAVMGGAGRCRAGRRRT